MITSLENKEIKKYLKLKKKKYRELEKLFLVEGEHLIKEAEKSNSLVKVILTEDKELETNKEILYVTHEIMKKLSNLDTPPEMIGVCKINDNNKVEGNIILELADNIGFAIVDRMLGGTGTPLDKSRDFTEIELVILERIIEVCTNLLVDPWESVVAVEPRLERIETNSQFAQFISPSEMTAIVTMNIKIGDTEGLMNICIPFSCVEPVIDKLNTKYWYSAMKDDTSGMYKDAIETIIDRAKIPVRAMLGRSTISVNDFANIQLGDIIKLDTKVDDELNVYVGNIKKFTALPGSSADSYAVRVTSVIKEEQ